MHYLFVGEYIVTYRPIQKIYKPIAWIYIISQTKERYQIHRMHFYMEQKFYIRREMKEFTNVLEKERILNNSSVSSGNVSL